MRVLFILKKNELYGFSHYCRRSSGLWNSTRFIVEGLRERGVHADIVEVNDNNDIDREITKHKPAIAVIEALWVVPEKFPTLMHLHPNIHWFCHLHSHMPFLALEGIAMDWITRYASLGVGLIANSKESYEAIACLFPQRFKGLLFLPNVYRGKFLGPVKSPQKKGKHWTIDVGCFGAIRPLKNQLLQALASIEYAKEVGKHLYFHINGTRAETGGHPVLKNLRQLFDQTEDADLVEHGWLEPSEFIHLLHHKIDIGLQVSLTETFNVVCADYVTAGIPVVASKEVKWLSPLSKAQDDSAKDIVKKIHTAIRHRPIICWNQYRLEQARLTAEEKWFKFVHA